MKETKEEKKIKNVTIASSIMTVIGVIIVVPLFIKLVFGRSKTLSPFLWEMNKFAFTLLLANIIILIITTID
jgi:hypothetical protein